MTRRMYDLPPKRITIASLRAVRSTCKLQRRILLSIGRRGRKTRAKEKKVGKRRKRTSMCDLPADLVGQEILTRVPITSLRSVRSTCKLWDALTKEWILGKAAAAKQQQFVGFITKNKKVCSVRFHLFGRSRKDKKDEDEEDLLDLSVKQVDLFGQVEISRVFHCDGLLLCVAKDHSRLVMWNPYLGQTQSIEIPTDIYVYRRNSYFHRRYCYFLGYDSNHNHKILRFLDVYGRAAERRYEIYEFNSNSWRVLKFTQDCDIDSHHYGVSLKGNAYFYARKTYNDKKWEFLLCFDFSTERFGPHLPLPFHSDSGDTVALSCVREEKLAILYLHENFNFKFCHNLQIWVTTIIEPNYVSWIPFFTVKIPPFALMGIQFRGFHGGGSFFIDEEAKVAVFFDLNRCPIDKTRAVPNHHHTDFVIGEGGYFKYVSLREAHTDAKPCPISLPANYFCTRHFCLPLMRSSSYLPSFVQLNQPHKGKERDV